MRGQQSLRNAANKYNTSAGYSPELCAKKSNGSFTSTAKRKLTYIGFSVWLPESSDGKTESSQWKII